MAVCARVSARDVHKDDVGGEYVLRQYIKRVRRSHGDKDARTLVAINRYAAFLQLIGRLNEAEPLFREALEGLRATLGPKHPNTLGSMNNLAALLHAQGKLAESEALFKETLESSRAALGPQHPNTLTTERLLAQVSQQRKGGGKRK